MHNLFEGWRRFLEENRQGTILAIFGPSGSGKSRQKNIFKSNGWAEIVSFVTRPPRGEEDVEYEFATEDEWKKEFDEGNLVNTNEYGGNFYGTKISDLRNADKAIMTGKKMTDREIFSHTGYPGGQKRISPSQMLAKDPTSVVRHAIRGMLPKNKLGSAILRNCYIYAGSDHKQEAQKPTSLNFNNIK